MTDPLIADGVRDFLAHRRIRCVAGTVAGYAQQLDDWLSWRGGQAHGSTLASVTLPELRAYLAQLGARCRPRTVRNHYRTLRALWRWLAYETDAAGAPLLAPHQLGFFANDRIALPPIRERERPAVSKAQVEQLLATIGEGWEEEPARNRAVVLLLWESGVRVHELAGLAIEQIDQAERQARIVGKGDKERYVFWGPRAALALRRYLRVRPGPAAGTLLRGVSSRNNGGPMTTNAIRLMLKRLAERAGVALPFGAVVHGFRHGCARELRRRGCTKEEVRDLLGHEDLRTTEHYLGLDAEAPRAAHRRAYPDDEDEPRQKAG